MLKDYPDVLTVKQVAEILNIGINAAYGLINERTIGSHRIGKSIRVPKSCLIDYINSARFGVSTIAADKSNCHERSKT